MKTIYKYQVPIVPSHQIPTAAIVKVLNVELDDNGSMVNIWCEVDNVVNTMTQFYTVATGSGIPHNAKHCGTIRQGFFVWHLYVDKNSLGV